MKKSLFILFNETHNEGKETLGGKGANLAEMTRLGFADSTRIHDYNPLLYGLFWQMLLSLKNTCNQKFLKAVKNLETETGKSFTADNEILLVSVRDGAAFSMPGMMDTIFKFRFK